MDGINAKWGTVGEGGTFYQWYVRDTDIEEAKQIKEGIGHASQIVNIDTGEVIIFDFFNQEWVPFGG